MLGFFRGEMSGDALLDYIDHLPTNSAYMAAIAEDEEYAEMVLAAEDGEPSTAAPPRLTEFGPEVRALAVVADKLSYLASIQIARAGKPAPRLDPYPRPITAIERKRRSRSARRHTSLVSRMLPGRA